MAMLFGTPQGRLSGGYKASLVARVHMRLGNWRKSVMPSEVSHIQMSMIVPAKCLTSPVFPQLAHVK